MEVLQELKKKKKKEAKEDRKPLINLSEKQKKALKVGAIAAGTALAAYGAYKLNQKVTKNATREMFGKIYTNTGPHALNKDQIKNARKAYMVNRIGTKKNKEIRRQISKNTFGPIITKTKDGPTKQQINEAVTNSYRMRNPRKMDVDNLVRLTEQNSTSRKVLSDPYNVIPNYTRSKGRKETQKVLDELYKSYRV